MAGQASHPDVRELGISADTVTRVLRLHGIRTQPQPLGPRRDRTRSAQSPHEDDEH